MASAKNFPKETRFNIIAVSPPPSTKHKNSLASLEAQEGRNVLPAGRRVG